MPPKPSKRTSGKLQEPFMEAPRSLKRPEKESETPQRLSKRTPSKLQEPVTEALRSLKRPAKGSSKQQLG